jgi:lambda family phage tail tape measure protein
MSIISRLGVILGLDSAEFNKGMGLANQSLTSFATVGNAAKLGVVAFARELLTLADQIEDLAKANQVSIASIIQLNIAMQQSGGSAEGAARSFSALTNKIDDAIEGNKKVRDSFAQIGVSIHDLETMDIGELYAKTVHGLAGLEDGVKRNALAFDLLGKSIRGTDIQDLNRSMAENAKLAESAQEEVGNMAKSWENLGVQFYKLKIVFMDLFGPVIDLAVDGLSFLLDILTKIMQVADYISEKIAKGFKYLGSGQWGKDLRDAANPVKAQLDLMAGYQGASSPNFAATDPILRKKKQTAEEEKLTSEIKKQNEALYQQMRTMDLEIKSIGKIKSEAEKLAIEFDKGGKYEKLRGTALEKNAMNLAKAYDVAKAKDFTQETIIQEQYAQERLKLEIAISGESDTQRAKKLALLKIDQDMVELAKKQRLKPEQIESIKQAKDQTVLLEESAKRTANTFQNGFSRAFENFKEKSLDSFSQGEMAFNSMADSMSSALDQFVATGKISFRSLIGDMIKQLIKLQLQAQFTSMFKGLSSVFGFGGGGSSGSGGLFGTAPSAGGLKLGFADGGSPPVGVASIVGERGPELFIPNTPGTIIPNNQLSSMGGGPQVVYNGPYIANMSAIDTQSATQFLVKNKSAVWSANQSAQRSLPQSR